MLRRLALFLLPLVLVVPLRSQSTAPRDAAELKLALQKLNVLGSVLYIAAHPDDENTALLAALAKGRAYRTAYLSCTRGEGGQNLIGPEQGDLLGLLRTQELLAARRIDGTEQYFTRAIDFGFSKTTDETLRMWGHDRTLGDMVWVIRSFRPDVIITRFTPTLGGHGNHTASAQLAEEAYRAASDPTKFPEQLRYVKPWHAKRLLWNVFRFSAADTPRQAPPALKLDLGAYSPLLGRSFTEIAGEGRSMHKSQGFGAAQNRGEFINYFAHADGDSTSIDLLDGVNTTWSRLPGSVQVQRTLAEAERTFDFQNPSHSVPLLLKALKQLSALAPDPWVEVKRQELLSAIAGCAGLWVDATTSDASAVPGGTVRFEHSIVNRSHIPITLERISLPFGGADTLVHALLQENRPLRIGFSLRLPPDQPISQPYWLVKPPQVGAYDIPDQTLVGQAQNDDPVKVRLAFSSPDGSFELRVPLRQKFIDPVDGESIQPFVITPPVAVDLEESVFVFPDGVSRQIVTTVKAGMADVRGTLRLRLPAGWVCEPASKPFELRAKGDEAVLAFAVHPSAGAGSGSFTAFADLGTQTANRGMQTVRYKHIPPQRLFPLAQGKLLRISLKTRGGKVGYIMGAGDEMPRAIRQMGYDVALLSDADLAEGTLSQYDVIVAGIRAANTRPALRLHQNRLLDYVHQGGTYVVQYVTPQRAEADNLGPYPFTVSRDRVTEEDATVLFVHPDHPLVTVPNRITAADFAGWVQERGLYFADRWDGRYDSVLVCHDGNEPGRAGGLLSARYGRGTFVYCAYAFFRQLPAGIEGAYRLFANILSYRQETK
jgi:LmbE family N-acetylglucosaminyl deacetylase